MHIDAFKLVLPVTARLLERLAAGQIPRPVAVIKPGQPLLMIGSPGHGRLIALPQFGKQQVEGPAIEDGVVDVKEQAGGAILAAVHLGAPERGLTNTQHLAPHGHHAGIGDGTLGIHERDGGQYSWLGGLDPDLVTALD